MPIEVKELIVRVTLTETAQQSTEVAPFTNAGLAHMQAGIVDACLKKVLEKLKEREEP